MSRPMFHLMALAAAILLTAGNIRAAEDAVKPLNEKDHEEFGRKLETAVAKGDKAALDQLIPITGLFELAIADLELVPKMRQSLMTEVEKSKSKFSFRDELLGEIKKGGKYTLLRTRMVEGRQRVTMRLTGSDDDLNYHEFLLRRDANGRVVAEDIYIFMTGEMLSSTLRRLVFNLLPAGGAQGLLEKLKGADQAYLNSLRDVMRFSTAAKAGRNKDAMAIYRKLPEELQNDKAMILMAIMVAQKADDDDEYLAGMERFRKAYPKDPAIDFISIDYYVLKKQYGKAIESIQRVEKAVGGDPYLQILTAVVLNQSGKAAEAKPLVEKAVQADPKLAFGYWVRVTISLGEKNHADTLTWLKKIVETGIAEIDADSIQKADGYAEFAKSPEFQKLKKWLAERKK